MDDVTFSKCKFSSGIVSYMYGEMAASESSFFESHLLECSTCTDEFATISNARFEVYEWKKLEFDPLMTPNIEIAFEAESSLSWIDKLRAAFAQSWAIPSVAVAGILVAAFAAAFILSQQGPPEVAGNLATGVAQDVPAVQRAPDVTAASVTPAPEISTYRESQPSAVSPRAPHRVSAKRTIRSGRSLDSTSAQNEQKAPRLNEFVDEEDTSVRLAELFEDVETSE